MKILTLNSYQKKIAFILFFLLGPFVSSLLAGHIEAEIDPSECIVGESVKLTVTVTGDLDEELQAPNISGIEVSGSGHSSQIQIINGSISRQTSIHYYLETKKAGNFLIPPIKAKIDGKTVSTKEIRLKVQEASDHIANDDNQLPDLFIERTFSNLQPYEGQSIIKKTKLYYKVQVTGEERETGKSSDFRIYEVGKESSKEQFGGQEYHVLNYYEVLIPQRSGDILVPADQLRVQLVSQRKRSRRNDLFSEFFSNSMSQRIEKSLASQKENLKVRPVPIKDRPNGYKGLIGQYSVSASLSHQKIKQGETSTLTLVVEGQGSLDSMGALELDFGPHIKVYPDKPSNEEKVSKVHGLLSKRTYKFALVPTKHGSIDLPPIVIPYFDPEKEKFLNLSSQLGSLIVEEIAEEKKIVSQNSDKGSISSVEKEGVKALAQDLIDIHRNFQEPLNEHGFKSQMLCKFLICLASLLFYLLSLFFLTFRKNNKNFNAQQRRSKALKWHNSEKSLWEKSWQGNKDDAEALQAYYKLFKNYIGHKFNCNGQTMTAREITHALSSIKENSEISTKAKNIASSIETVTYSSDNLTPEKYQKIYKNIDELIEEIESKC